LGGRGFFLGNADNGMFKPKLEEGVP